MSTLFRGKHLITFDDWTKQEINTVLDVSTDLKRRYALRERTILLPERTLFMIFFEQSTRTRNSMEAAMTQLGGHAHDLTVDKMQISHGESPRDTAKVLSRMGDGIAIRNCFHGIGNKYISEIARESDIPVISMQDDIYHPLQAIADLMTIQEYFGKDLKDIKIAVTWAYATSHAKPLSVPQSQALLFPRFGMNVVVANPVEFPLQKNVIEKAKKNAAQGGGNLTIVNDMDEAVRDADIVIPKNWGGFGYFDHYVDDDEHNRIMKENLEKNKDWIYDERRLALSKPDMKLMHAMPADRNKEVTDAVLDSDHSIIYDEAENRLHTARALLALTMGGRA
ncbi:MAG: ornithine carbamoyltransferase [Acidobacteria bacterium]|nr:MAG: ornithine carbamoyltransferase [Acidobacteriota bacterium]